MIVAFTVTVLFLSHTMTSFKIPMLKNSRRYSRIVTSQSLYTDNRNSNSKLYSEQGEGSADGNSAVEDDQGKKIEEMMKLFVTAIDEGMSLLFAGI